VSTSARRGRRPGAPDTRAAILAAAREQFATAGFLQHLGRTSFDGHIVLEINTRKSGNREERERDLVESLEFAREHFVVPSAHG